MNRMCLGEIPDVSNEKAENTTHANSRSPTSDVFTDEEDNILPLLVKIFGESNWFDISMKMNGRSAEACKKRWQYISRFRIKKRIDMS